VIGNESCNKIALNRCTRTEMRWCRKPTSLDSPVLRELLWPISFSRLLAIIIYKFGGSCLLTEFASCKIHCVQVLPSPVLAALLHGTRAVGVSQILRRGIFTRRGGHAVRHSAVELSSILLKYTFDFETTVNEQTANITGNLWHTLANGLEMVARETTESCVVN